MLNYQEVGNGYTCFHSKILSTERATNWACALILYKSRGLSIYFCKTTICSQTIVYRLYARETTALATETACCTPYVFKYEECIAGTVKQVRRVWFERAASILTWGVLNRWGFQQMTDLQSFYSKICPIPVKKAYCLHKSAISGPFDQPSAVGAEQQKYRAQEASLVAGSAQKQPEMGLYL